MDINIKLLNNRDIYASADSIGTRCENIITNLIFEYPKELDMSVFAPQLIFINDAGSFIYDLPFDTELNKYSNKFKVPDDILCALNLKLQVKLSNMFEDDTNREIWISKDIQFFINSKLDDSGNNIVSEAKTAQKNEDTEVLADSLETATSIDYSDKTFEELNTIVANLPIKTAEDTQDISNWDLINTYVETTISPINQIWTGNGMSSAFELPFLNTKNVIWTSSAKYIISNYLTKAGFSMNSASAYALKNSSLFSGKSLKYLKLTDMQNITSLYGAFYNMTQLTEIYLYELPSLINDFQVAFNSDTALVTIGGDELDFTSCTETGHTFNNCISLKNVKFKKNTLSINISLKDCSQLTESSVLSLINSISADDGIVLTLNIVTKTNCDSWYAKYNETDDIWESCESTDDGATTFTNIVTSSTDEHGKNSSIM